MLYVSADVEAVRVLWSRSGALVGRDVHAQLGSYAGALMGAYGSKEKSADVLVRNWWRPSADGSLATELAEREARLIAARDHGFDAWSSVGGECDERFESAVEAVTEGRTADLARLLADHPGLVSQRSAYGHRATLLHYVAANGVEIRRQVVPENAPAVAASLIDAGADPTARLRAYGGSYDVLQMLRTSGHPRAADVAGDLERELARLI